MFFRKKRGTYVVLEYNNGFLALTLLLKRPGSTPPILHRDVTEERP
jgi:hypothetical protein